MENIIVDVILNSKEFYLCSDIINYHIIKYVNIQDIISFSMTSKYYYDIINTNTYKLYLKYKYNSMYDSLIKSFNIDNTNFKKICLELEDEEDRYQIIFSLSEYDYLTSGSYNLLKYPKISLLCYNVMKYRFYIYLTCEIVRDNNNDYKEDNSNIDDSQMVSFCIDTDKYVEENSSLLDSDDEDPKYIIDLLLREINNEIKDIYVYMKNKNKLEIVKLLAQHYTIQNNI